MNRKIGREPPNQSADANVLNDGGIDTGGDDAAQVFLGLGKLIFKYQRVEGDVRFDSPAVQELDQLWQLSFCKVVRPHAGVETFQAEVNSVRAIFDSRAG